ncbi:MAG: hypothetical protein A2X13_05965 [Bacteroidetes bacterium GWC2_33_15]|nr:MAG: hypothetical protein A2X10_03795 [Bacteroidetes bacterium GWA2_33_15]OFX51770.1 MAG: hypothetical protein A2X13_05965 [Bacteroidetes bacterium GWC2_33_15]OFX66858.1 MAG: hypothetical protein A2X15_09160 [Bacteroidetes bacterium GWB2_32_14]OFX67116.1 MAG: hypothetical protein A2X14_10665 [Bacteroidetes bacterium GWD2_33_33]HAN17208.1 hypothetical protein [Bacteroidales bacterium]
MKNIKLTGLEVAVIGISCRFPGANNLQEYWNNLKNGVESITFFTDEELRKSGIDEKLIQDPDYIRAAGVLEDNTCFDSSFFNYTPNEAEVMDPQIRIFHECAWNALEDAGYNPEKYTGRIGLYGGASPQFKWEVFSELSGKNKEVGQLYAKYLTNKDFLFGLISYKLNLKGPSFAFYTACSTSLVAVHLACQSLINGECEMALAGGVTSSNFANEGYEYMEGMHNSADGHCRTFDAGATGMLASDGAGIVVLKRLEQAIDDKDHIYAIVKGSAINNDGNDKIGFAAPSIAGQSKVIKDAIKMANIKPNEITYVEAHGTATKLGDPIEINALKKAFNTQQQQFCRVGSVKTNIGHCDSAAGIAGFIKVVLSLKNKLIPPNLHFKVPNPEIDFENSPFIVNDKLYEWKTNEEKERIAGVSAFGIGGTNAHAILSEFIVDYKTSLPNIHSQLICISAKTPEALVRMSNNLSKYLFDNPDIDLERIAYTLNIGRKEFEYRKIMVADNTSHLTEILKNQPLQPADISFIHPNIVRTNIFVFSGQGSQYINIAKEIYKTQPIFKNSVDNCCAIINKLLNIEFQSILFPGEDTEEARELLNNIHYSGPAKFIIEYSVAQQLMFLGIQPSGMIGHSFGEYAVACLAGVFSLEDALTLIVKRAIVMEKSPVGKMMSVPLSPEEIKPYLNDKLSLAAVNTPDLCIVSGAVKEMLEFEQKIQNNGIEGLWINYPRASHSNLMLEVSNEFKQEVMKITLSYPVLPYISGLTGTWITNEQAIDPQYWADHLVKSILFSQGIQELMKLEHPVFIQVGGDKGLPLIIQQHAKKEKEITAQSMLRHKNDYLTDYNFFLSQLGELWKNGVFIDWGKFYLNQSIHRVNLPGYSFEKNLFSSCLDIERIDIFPQSTNQPDSSKWFYIPSWKKTLSCQNERYQKPKTWLVFIDDYDFGNILTEKLRKDSNIVITVKKASSFRIINDKEYEININNTNDYELLITHVIKTHVIQEIIYLYTLQETNQEELSLKNLEQRLSISYFALLKIVQSIGNISIDNQINISIITGNSQEIIGNDLFFPEIATVQGPAKTIPIEYNNISCRTIDVDLRNDKAQLAEDLNIELKTIIKDKVIGYRNGQRWIQCFENVEIKEDNSIDFSTIKPNGVYLITGGLGGIGFVLSEYLLKEYNVNLILTGRTALPERSSNGTYNKSAISDKKVLNRLKRLEELEKYGKTIQYYNLDVSEIDEMEQMVVSIHNIHERIDGLFHLAGEPDGKIIQMRSKKDDDKVFKSKIKGTLALESLINQFDIDFIIYSSSRNAIIPAIAHVGHTSANAFLDTYAHYQNEFSKKKIRTSINFNSWSEIGQAKESIQKLSNNQSDNIYRQELFHPLFKNKIKYDNLSIYVSHFSKKSWFLNEHRIDDQLVLPGTAYLELARMACEHEYMAQSITLSDICFLQPLICGDSEIKEIRVIIKKLEQDSEFVIISDNKSGLWTEHCIGKLAIHEELLSPKINIEEIQINPKTKLTQKENTRHIESNSGIKQFGERWQCITNEEEYDNKVIKFLELPLKFIDDFKEFKLHPSLLDCALGTSVESGFYLPFMYRNIRIYNSLQQSIISIISNIKLNEGNKKSITCDIRICDKRGNVLIEIDEYTRVSISMPKDIKQITHPTTLNQKKNSLIVEEMIEHDESFLKTVGRDNFNKESLTNSEGIGIFRKILKLNKRPHQLIISKSDFRKILEIDNIKKDKAFDIQKPLSVSNNKIKKQRPLLSNEYIEPNTKIEKEIIEIIQEYMGYDKIGINDSFFELGGDSLKAVFVINAIHKIYKIKIPITEFFKEPTVYSLALRVEMLINHNDIFELNTQAQTQEEIII